MRELARKIVGIDLERKNIDHNLKEIERKEKRRLKLEIKLLIFGAKFEKTLEKIFKYLNDKNGKIKNEEEKSGNN